MAVVQSLGSVKASFLTVGHSFLPLCPSRKLARSVFLASIFPCTKVSECISYCCLDRSPLCNEWRDKDNTRSILSSRLDSSCLDTFCKEQFAACTASETADDEKQ